MSMPFVLFHAPTLMDAKLRRDISIASPMVLVRASLAHFEIQLS
jgi:hypothetical protein